MLDSFNCCQRVAGEPVAKQAIKNTKHLTLGRSCVQLKSEVTFDIAYEG